MKPESLKIIGQEHSLRAGSVFQAELKGFDYKDPEQPRALRGLAQIINNGLCHRCGTCVGICPTQVLTTDQESYPSIKNLAACTDCDLCVKVCPGDEFDFHQHHQEKFGEPGEMADTHGHFLSSLVAHSNDPQIREHSTSGGLVTEILIAKLEAGEIDGAVVIVSDSDQIWQGKPVIARSKPEILAAMKSKYAIAPTNAVFQEIREMPGRYAVVGLPCQIHGVQKAKALDRKLAERVVLTIGIFCHAAVEYEGYRLIWESIAEEKREQATKFISRVGKHPGTPYIEFADQSQEPVYYPGKTAYRPSSMEIINILYRLYSPERCLTCFDALAEFADISIGDPWMAAPEEGVDFYKGYSFALIREPEIEKFVREMVADKRVTAVDVSRAQALDCNKMMSSEKVWRAFRIIETRRRQGRAVPKYADFELSMPEFSLMQKIRTEINIFTHTFCFLPFKYREPVLKFFLGNGGYGFLYLNNLRRKLREKWRDFRAGKERPPAN